MCRIGYIFPHFFSRSGSFRGGFCIPALLLFTAVLNLPAWKSVTKEGDPPAV
jgi:hypothetical protein